MSQFRVLDLPSFNDARGGLTVLESALPFEVKRTYWIYNASGQTRGGHRHRQTRQALIAVAGEVSIHINDGQHKQDILLAKPSQYLLVEPEDWHTMTFGANSVLLVMASHLYDKHDYIDEAYP